MILISTPKADLCWKRDVTLPKNIVKADLDMLLFHVMNELSSSQEKNIPSFVTII